jgi:hypothetical protein
MLVQDVHELIRDGQLEAMLTGVVNGHPGLEEALLIAALLLALPIVMVVLSSVLAPRVARLAHSVTVGLVAVAMATGGVRDLDDYVFTAMRIAALAAVVRYVWWPPADRDGAVEEPRIGVALGRRSSQNGRLAGVFE